MLKKFVHWSNAWYNVEKLSDHETSPLLLALMSHLSQLLLYRFFRQEVTLVSEDAYTMSVNGATRPRDDVYDQYIVSWLNSL